MNFWPATTSRLSEIDGFACHPGGAKVLDALEDAHGHAARRSRRKAASVLRDYGNMSAVTALFVAERMKLLMRPAAPC